MSRYDATKNQMVRDDDAADVQTLRRRFTLAEINAGASLLPAVPGYTYRITDFTVIAVGGAAAAATALVILGTRAAGAVTLFAIAIAALTRSAIVKPFTANVTVLADGASFTALDPNTAVTVGKTGAAMTTATDFDVTVAYVLEPA